MKHVWIFCVFICLHPCVAAENQPNIIMILCDQYPEVVKRLQGYAEKTMAAMPKLERPQPAHAFKRIKGGRLDFWNHPK